MESQENSAAWTQAVRALLRQALSSDLDPRISKLEAIANELSAWLEDRSDKARELGRELVEERAKSIDVQRRLAEAETRLREVDTRIHEAERRAEEAEKSAHEAKRRAEENQAQGREATRATERAVSEAIERAIIHAEKLGAVYSRIDETLTEATRLVTNAHQQALSLSRSRVLNLLAHVAPAQKATAERMVQALSSAVAGLSRIEALERPLVLGADKPGDPAGGPAVAPNP